jgi:hypothetical protein
MSASKQMKVLSVRLPDADLRRFKSPAASRGVSVQTAVHQALEAGASEEPESRLEPLAALGASLGDVDVFHLLREVKAAELRKDATR